VRQFQGKCLVGGRIGDKPPISAIPAPPWRTDLGADGPAYHLSSRCGRSFGSHPALPAVSGLGMCQAWHPLGMLWQRQGATRTLRLLPGRPLGARLGSVALIGFPWDAPLPLSLTTIHFL